MPQDNNEKMHNDLIVNRAKTSTDLTTNIIQRLPDKTGEATARLKAIIVEAGGAN